jgi:5,5'-dehydrodivanillate O-demethylase
MLTKKENELLTRVGAGTPAGELLRRYWHPVAAAQELSDKNPTMHVRAPGHSGPGRPHAEGTDEKGN